MPTKVIRMVGRRAEKDLIVIGNKRDNNYENIQFVLPDDLGGADVSLYLRTGDYSDVVTLGPDRTWTVERKHTQYPGRWSAYLEATKDGDVVWHSDPMALLVADLHDLGEQIQQIYPTAVEEAMKAAAQTVKDRAEVERLAGQVEEDSRAAAESAQKTARDAEQTSADRGTATTAAENAAQSAAQAERDRKAAEGAASSAKQDAEKTAADREAADFAAGNATNDEKKTAAYLEAVQQLAEGTANDRIAAARAAESAATDAQQTAADRDAAAESAQKTALDAEQTAQDRTAATAAAQSAAKDAEKTANDREAADASAAAAKQSAEQAAADAAQVAQDKQEVAEKVETEAALLREEITAEQTAREASDTALRADLTANAKADAATKRSLDALWKLNHGISYQFETDEAEAYSKTVPSGAKLASVESVGGKTVAWNQLAQISSNYSSNGVVNNKDGTYTINPGANSYFMITEEFNGVVGHKYFLFCKDGIDTKCYVRIKSGDGKALSTSSVAIVKYPVDGKKYIYLRAFNIENEITVRPLVFDLTLMYGSGNEPTSTADPRIAWIEQYAEAHPEYNAGELVSADVESVKYNDAVAADIPAAVRALPGYGWSAGGVCNSIERAETGWQYVQRVDSVDLGAIDWIIYGNNPFFSSNRPINYKYKVGNTNTMCSKYQYGSVGSDTTVQGIFVIDIGYIRVRDNTYTDTNGFKAAMGGVMLCYELAEPIITDITDQMGSVLDAITVEAGGTITLENAALLPVPSTEKYIVSLAEVGA